MPGCAEPSRLTGSRGPQPCVPTRAQSPPSVRECGLLSLTTWRGGFRAMHFDASRLVRIPAGSWAIAGCVQELDVGHHPDNGQINRRQRLSRVRAPIRSIAIRLAPSRIGQGVQNRKAEAAHSGISGVNGRRRRRRRQQQGRCVVWGAKDEERRGRKHPWEGGGWGRSQHGCWHIGGRVPRADHLHTRAERGQTSNHSRAARPCSI